MTSRRSSLRTAATFVASGVLALAVGAALTGCHEHGHRIRYRGHHEEIVHYRRRPPVVVHEVIPRRRPPRPGPARARPHGATPPGRRPGRRGRN